MQASADRKANLALSKILDDVVLLEPYDLILQLYKAVGIKLAIKSLLATPEVSALLELAQDPKVLQKLGARFIYEIKLCSHYPAWTMPSPFEMSISSYIAVILTIAPDWDDLIASGLLISKGLLLPHKIYQELSR